MFGVGAAAAAGGQGAGGAAAESELRIVEPLCAVFRRTLKRARLKYTPERAGILDAVVAMDGPFRAEELIDRLRARSPIGAGSAMAGGAGVAGDGGASRASKATVYRTIKLLQEAGIIQQVMLNAEQAHYQLAWGRRSAGLLVRTDTNTVEEVELPELAGLVERLCAQRALAVAGHRLVVYAQRLGSPGA